MGKKITISTLAKHLHKDQFQFTVKNRKTGWDEVYTLRKVAQGKHYVMRQRRHTNSSYYIGLLDGTWLKHTPGSRIPEDSAGFKTFRWLMTLVHRKLDLPKSMEISFMVKCKRCGRTLKSADAVNKGYGSGCWDKIHTCLPLHAQ